jgi:hypothetical protein
MIRRIYSFLTVTQFSQGSNVLDAPASKVDGFIRGNTLVSSTQLKIPMCSKESLSLP